MLRVSELCEMVNFVIFELQSYRIISLVRRSASKVLDAKPFALSKILDSVSPGMGPIQWAQNFGSAPKPGVTSPIRRHKVPLRLY